MIISLFFLLHPISLQADQIPNPPDSIKVKSELLATFSNGTHTPFWLVNNLYGLGSPEKNNGWFRVSAEKPLNISNKFSWGAGIDLVEGWNLTTPFRIQQLYGEIKFRSLWIMLGSKQLHSEYNYHKLSSGDLLFSENFMPIPQLRIGTKGFAPFWGTNEWLYVKAYLAYGMFTDSKWQKDWVVIGSDRTSNVLFCSRGLWIRVGKQKVFPLILDAGIEMGTQFGGTVYKNGEIINMPEKPIDWLKAIIPMHGGDDTPWGERRSVQGNMTGEYSLSLAWTPGHDWKIRAYFLHFFEDASQMFLEYGPWKDGLWGLDVKFPSNPFVSRFVYEYIHTTNQTGAVNHDWTPEIPEQVSGRDGYYTHNLYCAWQNWGMVMGSPLAISPIYNVSHLLTLYNTRFIANHFGLEGNPFKDLNWRTLFTFSRNWGTYIRPLPEIMNNFSGLVEISYKPEWSKGIYLKGALAWDNGDLLGNSFGGMVSIGYEGDFSLQRKKHRYEENEEQ